MTFRRLDSHKRASNINMTVTVSVITDESEATTRVTLTNKRPLTLVLQKGKFPNAFLITRF